MKKCPLCAEEIQEEAIKCKHCGEFLKIKAVVLEKESAPKGSEVSALTYQDNAKNLTDKNRGIDLLAVLSYIVILGLFFYLIYIMTCDGKTFIKLTGHKSNTTYGNIDKRRQENIKIREIAERMKNIMDYEAGK